VPVFFLKKFTLPAQTFKLGYMPVVDPIEVYKKTQFSVKDKLKAVTMLHDGAVRYINLFVSTPKQKGVYLNKALNILSQLLVSVDTSRGETAEGLYYLYEYLHHLLSEKKEDAVDEVKRRLKELQESLEKSRRMRG